MRRRLAVLALAFAATGCDVWYNDVPGPDDALHLVPWFDAMIKQPSVHPYQRADLPRYTVLGSVPIGGGQADWSAEWGVANTTTADKLANPIAGRPASEVGDTLYHTFCGTCHGELGAGNGLVGVKLAAPSLLTDRARGYTDGYLYSIIRYGRGVMPRYGDKVYQPPRRWEIVNFVRKLQADTVVPAPAPGGTQ